LALPSLLDVNSPNGQRMCAGKYTLSEIANGQPVWKLDGRNRWFFRSEGMWLIGGADVKAANFNHVAGFIYAMAAPGCIAPHEISGVWKWWDGRQFKDDDNITVKARLQREPHMTKQLPASEPSFMQETFEVVVRLMPSRTPSVPIPARGDGSEQGTTASKGAGAEPPRRRGPRPVQPESPRRAAVSPEVLLHSHKAIVAPPMLRVVSPNRQSSCGGLYELARYEEANGHPLWKSVNSDRWLYSGRSGKWMIGGVDCKASDFTRSAGYLFSDTVHNGEMPDQMAGTWCWWDGQQFVQDAAVVVSAACSPQLP